MFKIRFIRNEPYLRHRLRVSLKQPSLIFVSVSSHSYNSHTVNDARGSDIYICANRQLSSFYFSILREKEVTIKSVPNTRTDMCLFQMKCHRKTNGMNFFLSFFHSFSLTEIGEEERKKFRLKSWLMRMLHAHRSLLLYCDYSSLLRRYVYREIEEIKIRMWNICMAFLSLKPEQSERNYVMFFVSTSNYAKERWNWYPARNNPEIELNSVFGCRTKNTTKIWFESDVFLWCPRFGRVMQTFWDENITFTLSLRFKHPVQYIEIESKMVVVLVKHDVRWWDQQINSNRIRTRNCLFRSTECLLPVLFVSFRLKQITKNPQLEFSWQLHWHELRISISHSNRLAKTCQQYVARSITQLTFSTFKAGDTMRVCDFMRYNEND